MWFFVLLFLIGLGFILLSKTLSRRDRTFFLILWILVPFIGSWLFITFLGNRWNEEIPFKEARTEREMREIVDELDRYRGFNNQYPDNLNKLIGNDPVKSKFRRDYWQQLYYYQPSADKQSFSLISSGEDARLNTTDDLVVKSSDRLLTGEK